MKPSRICRLVAVAVAAVALVLAAPLANAAAPAPSPAATESFTTLWQAYQRHFIAASGRVIDASRRDRRTTSEGQAYALFFALVGNDRALFRRLLHWTQNNLAQGNLAQHLPAWLWGREKDGSWGVKDSNSAADADLWLAYTLMQAGRLWADPAYTRLGKHVAAEIAGKETADLGALGPVLLPGQAGFGPKKDGCYDLNFSYMPLPLLTYLGHSLGAPWRTLAAHLPDLLRTAAPKGFVPDWNRWCPQSGLGLDPRRGATGSFDAIRVYLWAGLTPAAMPGGDKVAAALYGMTHFLHARDAAPEHVDTVTATTTHGQAPVGFDAALLPFARAQGLTTAFHRLAARVQAAQGGQNHLLGQPPRYYDQNLALFALGDLDQAYRFSRRGQLGVAWHE